jgi:predicted O-methyltransferase YrrM
MTALECRILRDLFSSYNSEECIGVEVGSFLGRSSWEISKSIPLGKLFCVDKWDNWKFSKTYNATKTFSSTAPALGTPCSIELFLENTKECTNITTIQADAPKHLADWNQQIDFLFLDAEHANPSDREWLDFWLPKIKPGGRLAGHDFYMGNSTLFPDIHANIRYLQTLLNQRVKHTRSVTTNESSIWYFDI